MAVRSLLALVMVLWWCVPWIVVVGVEAAATAAASAPAKRWVRFELAGSSGDLQFGQSLDLSIVLGGVFSGSAPIVAICDSPLFRRQMVTLEPDSLPSVLKGTITLEPASAGRTSVQPKAARIHVTFARLRNDRPERFMSRVVYLTLGRQQALSDSGDGPLTGTEQQAEADVEQDEIQPDVEPVTGARIAEEDLVPLPPPGEGKAYWKQVSHLVSRSWSRHVRSVRHVPTSETVRVRFKLYPSGRAQLIEIEKGSGAREIDEAGIYAVVHAQPFPPFPPELAADAVDVHVRMRTGARTMLHDSQPITAGGSPAAKAAEPATSRKK